MATKLILAVGALLSIQALSQSQSSCVKVGWGYNDKQMQLRKNLAINMLWLAYVDECQKLCGVEAKCNYWTWNKTDGACIIQNSTGLQLSSSPDYLSGPKDCLPHNVRSQSAGGPLNEEVVRSSAGSMGSVILFGAAPGEPTRPPQSEDISICYVHDKGYTWPKDTGKAPNMLWLSSPRECADTCGAEPHCANFTWHKSNGACWLFENVSALPLTPLPGVVVSGPKACNIQMQSSSAKDKIQQAAMPMAGSTFSSYGAKPAKVNSSQSTQAGQGSGSAIVMILTLCLLGCCVCGGVALCLMTRRKVSLSKRTNSRILNTSQEGQEETAGDEESPSGKSQPSMLARICPCLETSKPRKTRGARLATATPVDAPQEVEPLLQTLQPYQVSGVYYQPPVQQQASMFQRMSQFVQPQPPQGYLAVQQVDPMYQQGLPQPMQAQIMQAPQMPPGYQVRTMQAPQPYQIQAVGVAPSYQVQGGYQFQEAVGSYPQQVQGGYQIQEPVSSYPQQAAWTPVEEQLKNKPNAGMPTAQLANYRE